MRRDFLKFYGLPLTGGSNKLPMWQVSPGLFASGFSSGPDLQTWQSGVFLDRFFPFISYFADKDNPGDLLPAWQGPLRRSVEAPARERAFGRMPEQGPDHFANVFSIFGKLIFGDQSEAAQGVLKTDFTAMTLKDFGGKYAYDAVTLRDSGYSGDFNFVFKKANPIYAILAMLPPTAITGALFVGGIVDEVIDLAVAAGRYAKALAWAKEGDPLVLDLDGDGIETTRLNDEQVRFDQDLDLFAERTGWIDPDDGILAIDLNGNGRIDDISELFGDADTGGYQALVAANDNRNLIQEAA